MTLPDDEGAALAWLIERALVDRGLALAGLPQDNAYHLDQVALALCWERTRTLVALERLVAVGLVESEERVPASWFYRADVAQASALLAAGRAARPYKRGRLSPLAEADELPRAHRAHAT